MSYDELHTNKELPGDIDTSPVDLNDDEQYTVGNFWFDHLQWKAGTQFLIREFTNEPKVPFLKRNTAIGREIMFFLSLVFVGSIIVRYRWGIINKKEFFASMFFASGLIPAIQLTLFDILPRKFKRIKVDLDTYLSGILSIVFLSVALVVYPTPDESEDSWALVTGKILFEAGLIYFVSRVLFFVPNPNDEVRKLKEEIDALKQSMVIGLADGYFWNFVKEIAMDIRDANGPQHSLKLTYPPKDGKGFTDEFKKVKRFLVIVPRSLEWNKEDPIADVIGLLSKSGHFKNCKIEKSPQRKDSPRIKWVTDVIFNPERSNSSDDIKKGIVVDIPTTLTALLMNLRSKTSSIADIDKEKFASEASAFSYRISWQVKKENLQKYVKVIEVESTKDLLQVIHNVDEFIDESHQMSLNDSDSKTKSSER